MIAVLRRALLCQLQQNGGTNGGTSSTSTHLLRTKIDFTRHASISSHNCSLLYLECKVKSLNLHCTDYIITGILLLPRPRFCSSGPLSLTAADNIILGNASHD